MRSRTSAKGIERQKQLSQFLADRLRGKSFREIGEAQTPRISPQAVHKAITTALKGVVAESVAELRALEALRLDELQNAIWPQALLGDIAAVDRCLAIMKRRAQMLGLDLQSSYGRDGDGETDQVVRVEIVGNPEIARVRWLEEERERLLALTEGSLPPSSTLN
jgi:hypothetical protein